jgi:hypothetical protein
VETGLRAYEGQRIGVGRRFIAQARRLGSYLKYEFPSEEERARAAFHAAPEQVMAETALLDFLRTESPSPHASSSGTGRGSG